MGGQLQANHNAPADLIFPELEMELELAQMAAVAELKRLRLKEVRIVGTPRYYMYAKNTFGRKPSLFVPGFGAQILGVAGIPR